MLHAFSSLVIRRCTPLVRPVCSPSSQTSHTFLVGILHVFLRLLEVHGLEHFIAGEYYGTSGRSPDHPRPNAREERPAATLALYLP